MSLNFFKAYDIRGKLGEELDKDMAYRIGRAYAQWLKPKDAVVGGDIRHTSVVLKSALAQGLRDEGVDVLDIGLCGTEEIYFATTHLRAGGGIMVTASHNPVDYNGMKLVREDAKPISGDTGLQDIAAIVEANEFSGVDNNGRGSYLKAGCFADYLAHLEGYVDKAVLRPLRIVVNPGNGAAGPVLDGLESKLPFELVKVNYEPDGSFPNGIPNPLLPGNRAATVGAVMAHRADLGLAWDGDFDRCFFFDETGAFIEGYYIVGLLAAAFLRKQPGAKIIHDPRLIWNTIDICKQFNGRALQSKCGHAFIKEAMRAEDAVYGGEMSAHHYFRDFSYCDSGMIPWLLVAELLSITGKPLSELVNERVARYPCSGEINNRVESAPEVLRRVEERYRDTADSLDKADGLGMNFADWRFNLRASNTEPVIRLNLEALNAGDVERRVAELLVLIKEPLNKCK